MDYLCFVDFEFTCFDKFVEDSTELLSIGAVVVEKEKLNIIDDFYLTAKPVHNSELSQFCKDLTKLSQEEINRSKSSIVVVNTFIDYLDFYNVKQVYTFGSTDARSLILDSQHHKSNKRKSHIVHLAKMLIDAQQEIIETYFRIYCTRLPEIGLNEMMRVVGINRVVRHHALYDAYDLAEVWNKIRKTQIQPEYFDNMRAKYNGYIPFKNNFEAYSFLMKTIENERIALGIALLASKTLGKKQFIGYINNSLSLSESKINYLKEWFERYQCIRINEGESSDYGKIYFSNHNEIHNMLIELGYSKREASTIKNMALLSNKQKDFRKKLKKKHSGFSILDCLLLEKWFDGYKDYLLNSSK